MRKALVTVFLAGALVAMGSQLAAQTVCPGYAIIINTPEDELTLAYNGAEGPQDQIAALDKFMAAQAESKFAPCAHEYYTMAYLKLNNYDKVIEHGEKAFSLGHRDVMTSLNVAKAYVASGKVGDGAFDAIVNAAEVIRTEGTPSRSSTISEEEWKKESEAATAQANDWRAYMEYAFFQLIQREPDASKRIPWLDKFAAAYPDSPNAGQLHFQYFLAYQMTNQGEKAFEAGEKAVAVDPNNVTVLNVVADDYAARQINLEKAELYAKKAEEVIPTMSKPEAVPSEQFKASQDFQLGLSQLTLGYIAFQRGAKTKKVAPAIDLFKKAVDLLGSNPQMQGKALYFLGYAYEVLYPPNHKGAMDALTRAAGIASPWQGQSQKLLADVKKAAGVK